MVPFIAVGCSARATPRTSLPPSRPPVGANVVRQPAAAPTKALKLDLSTYVGIEPVDVIASARVEPDTRSRWLMFEWRTPDGVGGSHLVSLDGESAPLRHVCAIAHMTEGDYIVSAVLQRDDGTFVRQQRFVRVLGKGESWSPPTMGIAEDPF
jgi:hypothetical protein